MEIDTKLNLYSKNYKKQAKSESVKNASSAISNPIQTGNTTRETALNWHGYLSNVSFTGAGRRSSGEKLNVRKGILDEYIEMTKGFAASDKLAVSQYPQMMYSFLDEPKRITTEEDMRDFNHILEDYMRLPKINNGYEVSTIIGAALDNYHNYYGPFGLDSEISNRAACYRNMIRAFAAKGYRISSDQIVDYIYRSCTPEMMRVLLENFAPNSKKGRQEILYALDYLEYIPYSNLALEFEDLWSAQKISEPVRKPAIKDDTKYQEELQSVKRILDEYSRYLEDTIVANVSRASVESFYKAGYKLPADVIIDFIPKTIAPQMMNLILKNFEPESKEECTNIVFELYRTGNAYYEAIGKNYQNLWLSKMNESNDVKSRESVQDVQSPIIAEYKTYKSLRSGKDLSLNCPEMIFKFLTAYPAEVYTKEVLQDFKDVIFDDYKNLPRVEDDIEVRDVIRRLFKEYKERFREDENPLQAQCFQSAIACFADKGYSIPASDIVNYIETSETPEMMEVIINNFLPRDNTERIKVVSALSNSNSIYYMGLAENFGYPWGMFKSPVDSAPKASQQIDKPSVNYQTLIDNISEKYDIYDINNWEKIFEEMQSLNDTRYMEFAKRFTIENLPDIFYTEENKEQYKKVVKLVEKFNGNWNLTDSATGENLAHRAAMAENPLLIKLAHDKGVDFCHKNKAGKTAIDYLNQYNSNPEMREVLKNIKINYPVIVDLASKGLVTVLPMIIKTPGVNVNSVDKNMDNAAIVAARNGNVNVIKYLNTLEDFDMNYINPKTGKDALSSVKDVKTFNAILENKNINPNAYSWKNPPLAFKFLSNDYGYDILHKDSDRNLFHALLKHPKFNPQIVYNNLTLSDAIRQYTQSRNFSLRLTADFSKEISEILNKATAGKVLNNAREIVDKNGVLTLEQIKEFLNSPNSKFIINEPLNDSGEPIGFFVADIPLEFGNITDFLEIMDLLFANKYDFTARNNFGQTLLDKSKDAENNLLTEYLQNSGVRK